MTFDELLASRAIERIQVENDEVTGLFSVAQRDVHTAEALLGTDLDWAFAVAYNAILQLSIAYMAMLGYRPRGQGKHFNTFRFMKEALPEESKLVARLQQLRQKRNASVYEHAGLLGEQEARDTVAFAQRYYAFVEEKMPEPIRRSISQTGAD